MEPYDTNELITVEQTFQALTFKPGNGLKLKFGAKGKVTVSGKVSGVKVSGSAWTLPVAWVGEEKLLAQTCVYVAPKKGLKEDFCEVYDVLLTVGEKGKFNKASDGGAVLADVEFR